MNPIVIRVPAVPIPQPRARAQGKLVNGKPIAHVHEVTHVKGADGNRRPHAIVEFKATVRMVASQEYTAAPLDEPVRVDIDFIMPRPSGKIWKTKPMPRYWHTGQKDRDNLDKAVLDALTGILWMNDGIVCDGRLRKLVASGDEQPHVLIIITPCKEP